MSTWLDGVFTTPCQVVPRVAAGHDDYGNVTYDDGDALPTHCRVDAVSRDETDEGRTGIADYTVLLPAAVDGVLDTFCAIDVEGYPRLEVTGPPRVFRLPRRTGVHHVEVDARRSTAT